MEESARGFLAGFIEVTFCSQAAKFDRHIYTWLAPIQNHSLHAARALGLGNDAFVAATIKRAGAMFGGIAGSSA